MSEPADYPSHQLAPGSVVVERYVPDKGGVQWLASVVDAHGDLWLMRACKSRREALDVLDKHADGALRNAVVVA